MEMREGGAKEEAKLSEFQEEIVQLAAVLNGDHRKDIYPDKLVENMTVAEAAKYAQDGFKKFLNECEKARASGVDEEEIVECPTSPGPSSSSSSSPPNKSFVHKIFSCLICSD